MKFILLLFCVMFVVAACVVVVGSKEEQPATKFLYLSPVTVVDDPVSIRASPAVAAEKAKGQGHWELVLHPYSPEPIWTWIFDP